MAGVALEAVSKSFNAVIAVDKLSMTVNEGELLVLLGPSGCGKTTTLRLIAGLEKPELGQIIIDGEVINDIPSKDRDVAMVFQSYALFPHKSVFDNIAFPLVMRNVPRDELNRGVREVAALLQIESLLSRMPAQLSGGEQQRVALARAIVRRPKVFLMDEPLSNLDAKLRFFIRAELKALQKELGTTTIYVTHDQVEAMTMADRIALLHKGRLMQLASPMEIYRNPMNLFVAGFMGAPPMNLIECELLEKNAEVLAAAEDMLFNCGETGRAVLQRSGSAVVLGVRAENIHVHNERSKRSEIKGKIFVLEPLGSETIADVKVGNQLLKVKVPPDFAAERGQEVWLDFSVPHVHFFERNGGALIV